ncbi:hypothetical protein [Metabacillus fastidiosus]|uniref:Uncharacterized protein n=1 Tax=Metabacillus fastidiosus TaxID=1458 RepID=A0ABU6NUD1_9BACI|nr:hypothetical protein [Metabacillus fastidiosus]
MDERWNLQEMELDEFRDRIAITHRTSETVEQYRKMTKAQQDEIKNVGGFVLGTLTRNSQLLQKKSLLETLLLG